MAKTNKINELTTTVNKYEQQIHTLIERQDSLAKINDSLIIHLDKFIDLDLHPYRPTFPKNSRIGQVYKDLLESGIKCPEGVLALASAETARFSSKLSKMHNLFGLAYTPKASGKV